MKSLINAPDRTDVFQRLERVRADSPPNWGRMSAHEMICHLSDAFRMGFGERTLSANRSFLSTTIVKWIALYTPLPWPRNVKSPPEADPHQGGTSPAEFAHDMRELKRLVERFRQGERRGDNPVLGPLTHWQWMRWGYLHLDHHLRQFGV